jgi:hypothetical protein
MESKSPLTTPIITYTSIEEVEVASSLTIDDTTMAITTMPMTIPMSMSVSTPVPVPVTIHSCSCNGTLSNSHCNGHSNGSENVSSLSLLKRSRDTCIDNTTSSIEKKYKSDPISSSTSTSTIVSVLTTKPISKYSSWWTPWGRRDKVIRDYAFICSEHCFAITVTHHTHTFVWCFVYKIVFIC